MFFRIVFIDTPSQHVWLCRIDDDSWPILMEMYRVMEELDPEKVVLQLSLRIMGAARYFGGAEG